MHALSCVTKDPVEVVARPSSMRLAVPVGKPFYSRHCLVALSLPPVDSIASGQRIVGIHASLIIAIVTMKAVPNALSSRRSLAYVERRRSRTSLVG